jgi:hypothetical protein
LHEFSQMEIGCDYTNKKRPEIQDAFSIHYVLISFRHELHEFSQMEIGCDYTNKKRPEIQDAFSILYFLYSIFSKIYKSNFIPCAKGKLVV